MRAAHDREQGCNRSQKWDRRLLVALCALVASAEFAMAAPLPEGWFQTGGDYANYAAGVDATVAASGSKSVFVKSLRSGGDSFGAIIQTVSAHTFEGEKVRLTAKLKTKRVKGWAGLWMRVDGKGGKRAIQFDNMSDRPVRGSKNFARYEVVLDVPQNADTISFGAILHGDGMIWADDFTIAIAPKSMPTTKRKRTPRNLDFE